VVDRGVLIPLGAEVVQGQLVPVALVRTGPRGPGMAAVGGRMQKLVAAVGFPRAAGERAVLIMFRKG